MAKKKLRVGIIGTGGIAGMHAAGLQKVEAVEVIAGADVNEKALSAFSAKYGLQHTFTDYREMLKLEALDAVSVCTPNFMHKEPTVAALKAGKHVMVEKPMAMTAREAQAMVDAAAESNLVLTIGFQFRFSPAAQVIKRYYDEGQLGSILYSRVQALRRRGIPNWGVFGRKELQGGGPLIDIGVHMIELAHYLMGSPRPAAAASGMWTYLGNKPSDVMCMWPNWDHRTYTVEDLATGFVRFENGASMCVESSFAAHIEDNVLNVTLMGDKGGASYSPLKVFRDEAGVMVNIQPSFTGDWSTFDYKMAHWVAVIRGEEKNKAPGEDGLMVQKILDGLYRSAEKGKEVRIS